jgi:hypothetical protein
VTGELITKYTSLVYKGSDSLSIELSPWPDIDIRDLGAIMGMSNESSNLKAQKPKLKGQF